MSEHSSGGAAGADQWLGREIDGRYRIESVLGAGGLGMVFRATHLGLDRAVALKVLHEDLLHDEGLRKRFDREVKMLSKLAHPHIVTLTDSGVLEDGMGYLVMELLEGESLETRLERGALVPEEALDVCRQLLLGLAEAHDKGILHRDIKPANVFMQPLAQGKHVKLLDFGLAKVRKHMADDPAAYSTLTATGTLVGTPTYMAPELLGSAEANPTMDVYAVGVVLFEMLTGDPPFASNDKVRTIRMHVNDPVPPLEEVAPELRPTPELRAFVLRALAKDPAARFASARDMLRALDLLPSPAATVDLGILEAAAIAARGRAPIGTENTIQLGSDELSAVELELARGGSAKVVISSGAGSGSGPGPGSGPGSGPGPGPGPGSGPGSGSGPGPGPGPGSSSGPGPGSSSGPNPRPTETASSSPKTEEPAQREPSSEQPEKTRPAKTRATKTRPAKADAPKESADHDAPESELAMAPTVAAMPTVSRKRRSPLAGVLGVLVVLAVGAWVWIRWRAEPPTATRATPSPAPATEIEPGATVATELPDNPFQPGTLPTELVEARRSVMRGRRLGDGQVDALDAYQLAHPDDPRPSLLLARHERLGGHWAPMVERYVAADAAAESARGFPSMLTDLVRAARDEAANAAATDALVRIFGAAAVTEIDQQLNDEMSEDERARLVALRGQLAR